MSNEILAPDWAEMLFCFSAQSANSQTKTPFNTIWCSMNNKNASLLDMFVWLVRNDFLNSYGQLQDEKDRQIGSAYARRPVLVDRSMVSSLWFF